MMLREVTEGTGMTGIRAGVLKLASRRDAIRPYGRVLFQAAARVQRETGVPIITPTQQGRQGPRQAELLVGEGADPERIMIGHMNGNTDPDYHRETLKHGVNIAFDRLGLQGLVGTPMDTGRLRVLETLLGDGHARRILLSHDSIWPWLDRPLPMPDAILPELLRRGVTQTQITQMTVGNPARVFG